MAVLILNTFYSYSYFSVWIFSHIFLQFGKINTFEVHVHYLFWLDYFPVLSKQAQKSWGRYFSKNSQLSQLRLIQCIICPHASSSHNRQPEWLALPFRQEKLILKSVEKCLTICVGLFLAPQSIQNRRDFFDTLFSWLDLIRAIALQFCEE